MVGRFEIKILFNIYKFLEVEQSANKIKIFSKRYDDYVVIKIDLNYDQTVAMIKAFYFDYFSDAKNKFLNIFED